MENHFYLIRHGETEWNRLRKLQGHTDIPLNQIGIEQAKQIAKRLAHIPLHVICTSDLLRAKQTANEIIKYHKDRPLVSAKEFRERNYGKWEGLHWEELASLYPEDVKDPKIGGKHGIETIEEMQERSLLKLQEFSDSYQGQHIAVVSHGGLINALLHKVSNGRYGTGITKLGNTSYNHISHCNGKWEIHTVNDTSHLHE